MRYIAELERKVETLQTEATTLSAQLAIIQVGTRLPFSLHFSMSAFLSFISTVALDKREPRDKPTNI